jgi:hypothetical protein
VSTHLPAWYAKGLKQEIARLREMLLEPFENRTGGVEDKTAGSLTSQFLDRHKKAMAELQSILDDDEGAKP